MKKLKNSLPLLLILALVTTAMASLSPVTASPVTSLGLYPSAFAGIGYIPGTTFVVNVNVTDVNDLFGYEFKLAYDTSLLTATSSTPGAFFPTPNSNPNDGNAWLLKNEINDGLGYVWYAVTLDAGTPSGNSGNGILATISFTVDPNALGGTILDLFDTVLADSSGNAIAHEVYDGAFTNKSFIFAAFAASTTTPDRQEVVYFDASSSISLYGGVITSYFWDFGDNARPESNTATIAKPSHWYPRFGTYTVTLTVTDNLGGTDTVTGTINVVEDLIKLTAYEAKSQMDVMRLSWMVQHKLTNTLFAKVHNYDTAPWTVKVVFTIFDQSGKVYRIVPTLPDTVNPGHALQLTAEIYPPPVGTWYIKAQAFRLDSAIWIPSYKTKTLTVEVVP